MSRDDKISASYELAPHHNPFLPNSNIQFAWDSVSLSAALSCPRRYYYQSIKGYVPRNPNYAIALVFGILFHEGLEHYHRARAKGADHNEAVEAAVKHLIAQPATATLPDDSDIEVMKETTDEDDDGVTFRNSKLRTRYYLFRAVVWYLDNYENEQFSTVILPSGEPAVEQSFRVPLPIDVAGTQLILCGHIDRVVSFNDFYYVVDYKTTKSLTTQFFAMFNLSHQMTGYTVGGNVILDKPVQGVWIDGAALQVGGVKFGRAETRRTPSQIGEYFDMLGKVVADVIHYDKTDNWPMNTSACYFCDFKGICSLPPELRPAYLKAQFEQKPGWNPLANR